MWSGVNGIDHNRFRYLVRGGDRAKGPRPKCGPQPARQQRRSRIVGCVFERGYTPFVIHLCLDHQGIKRPPGPECHAFDHASKRRNETYIGVLAICEQHLSLPYPCADINLQLRSETRPILAKQCHRGDAGCIRDRVTRVGKAWRSIAASDREMLQDLSARKVLVPAMLGAATPERIDLDQP